MEKLTQKNYYETIKEGISLVVVGAPWCPDCRKIEPILALLEQEFKTRVHFFELKADEEANLKEELNVRRIPTLIFYKNGIEIHQRLVEPNSKPLIESAIKMALES